MARIVARRDENTKLMSVFLDDLDEAYSYSDRTATFALYEQGYLTPLDTKSCPVDAYAYDTYDYIAQTTFNVVIEDDIHYVVGCTVSTGDWSKDIDTKDVYYPRIPQISYAERNGENIEVYVDYNPDWFGNMNNGTETWYILCCFCDESGYYVRYDYREISRLLSGTVHYTVSAHHLGMHYFCFAYDNGEEYLDYMAPSADYSGMEYYVDACVSKWYWNRANGANATRLQTINAKCVVDKISGYVVGDFSHTVWNDLVDKVNDFFAYRGFSWDSYFLALLNTKMWDSEEGRTLTAHRFNSLIYNLNRLWYSPLYNYGLDYVNYHDIVYGGYFDELVNCINDNVDYYLYNPY